MKINFNSKSIEMNQTTLNRASHYGTPEYAELRAILEDFPTYQVQVIRRHAPKSYVGLSYADMEAYIETCEESASAMEEFRTLRALGSHYSTIKKWFLYRFPTYGIFAA